MKTKLLISLTAFLFAFFAISCQKDDDTSSPEKTPEEILTSRTWRLDEIRFLQGNSPVYYKRSVTNDPGGFDTESIKFNTDKTGTYTAGGVTYTTTWEFINPTKTKVTFIINYSAAPPLTVNWENIVYKESSINYAEYYNRSGSHSLAVGTRIP